MGREVSPGAIHNLRDATGHPRWARAPSGSRAEWECEGKTCIHTQASQATKACWGFRKGKHVRKKANHNRNWKRCVIRQTAGRHCGRPPSGIPLISTLNYILCSLQGREEEQGLGSAQQEEEEGKPLVQYQLLSLPSQTLDQGQTPK